MGGSLVREYPPKVDATLWSTLVTQGIINSGSSFPTPGNWQVFMRTDEPKLYAYEGNNWISLSRNTTPASLTVFKSGSKYFAENGTTGKFDYSGTNASTVLQSCLSALYTGGVLFLNKGVYEIPTLVLITGSNIKIKGEGKSTEFRSTADTGYFFALESTGSVYCSRITFEDVLFNNPNSGSYDLTAIDLRINTDIIWQFKMQDCYFFSCNAVWTQNTSAPKTLNNATFNRLLIEDPPTYTFKMYDVIDVTWNDIRIYVNNYDSGTYGIWLFSDLSSGCIIDNTRIFRTQYGIVLSGSDDTKISNTYCDFNDYSFFVSTSGRCHFTNCYAHTPNGSGKIGYYLDGGSTGNVFTNCLAMNCEGRGFYNNAVGTPINSFIGCQAVSGSYVGWEIKPTDKTRGCLDIPDQGPLHKNSFTITFTGEIGSQTHGLPSTVSLIRASLTPSGSAGNTYMGGLNWYPSGSAGIYIIQTGSGTISVGCDVQGY